MGLGQRTAKYGKVLGKGVGQAAVDGAVARDHSVAQNLLLIQAKKGAAVGDQRAQLLKTALVKEQFEALAGGELFFRVLGVDAGLAAAEKGFRSLGRKRIKGLTRFHSKVPAPAVGHNYLSARQDGMTCSN